MNIDAELKKEGIEVTQKLDDATVRQIAQKVSCKICNIFSDYGIDEAELFDRISKLDMYRAKREEGLSEANYFYKNQSIYFNCNIPDEDIEEFAVHECIHFIQEVKDSKNRLIRMGLADYRESKVTGTGLNEAAVQLMASYANKMEKEYVKYYGISFETVSPSYYPLECCLVNQLAYLIGEEILFESTLNSNDKFKDKLINETSVKTYLCVLNGLDTLLDTEEEIIKLNNKILEIEDGDKRYDNLAGKVNELKNEILLTFLKTQNFIISSYFNNKIKKIKTLEELEDYRQKLYKFKDYLGSTDGYTFYHDFYVEKMAELEHRHNIIENGGKETALEVRKESLFAVLIRKIKELFGKKNKITGTN